MNSEYLIVHKSVLPDCYERVVRARELIRTGAVREVSEAARMVGISRSTYYKYKDFIFAPSENTACKKAIFSMLLSHERGVLNCLSDKGANILTIMQNPPIGERASVIISADITGLTEGIDAIIAALFSIGGVERAGLLDVE